MKLLVMSVIEVEPSQLTSIADRIKDNVKDFDENDFCKGLMNGKAYEVDFGDGLKSTYNIINREH